MMGLGKLQRLAKFEVAGFFCYGNIRKLVFKIWDKPKWENPLLFGETDFTVGFEDQMFPIRCVTVVELYTTIANVRFLRKTAFYYGIFQFRGAVKWGLKIIAPNYQKAHPYAKSGLINRLALFAIQATLWRHIYSCI